LIIRVERGEGRRYATTVQRADGVGVVCAPYGFVLDLPRDIAQFAIESALVVRNGFWGAVAAGAVLPGMSLASGQNLSAEATRRSEWVLTNTRESVAEAKWLAVAFGEILEKKLETQWPVVLPALQFLTVHRGARIAPLTKIDVARVVTAWRDVEQRWAAVAPGGTLELQWTTPLLSGSFPVVAQE